MKIKFALLFLVVQFMYFINCWGQSALVWDGGRDDSWYVGHESDDTYTITTPRQLEGLRYWVNTKSKKFDGKTINIGSDPDNPLVFDMNGRTWNPIGTSSRPFCGSINGNNCIIKNLKITGSSDYRGVFGYVKSNRNVDDDILLRDINVEATVSGRQYVGGVCGYLSGYSGSEGGVTVYKRNAEIRNCTFKGNVSGSGQSNYVGGIVGSLNYGKIDGCAVAGRVFGSVDVGGVVGYINSSVYSPENISILQNCTSSAFVIANENQAGGIAGYVNNTSICYCVNAGNVNGSTSYNGGIVGLANNNVVIEYCFNSGSVNNGGAISGGGGNMSYCYYDKQRNCVKGVYGSNDIENKYVGLLTTEATGVSPSGLAGAGWNLEHWIFGDNLYPMPTCFESSDLALLASAPIFLNDLENYKNVTSDFDLSTYASWASGSLFVTVSGSRAEVSATDGYAELTATIGSISKIVSVSRQDDDNVLIIRNLSDFRKFRDAVNSGGATPYNGYVSYNGYSGYTFRLDDNINISSSSVWVSIGKDAAHPFCGNFDGNGKTISGLNDINAGGEYHGLFGYVTGTIKDLTVIGDVQASKHIGGICGYLGSQSAKEKAKIENCHFIGTVATVLPDSTDVYVGGIVGEAKNYAYINRCSTTGHISMVSASGKAKCIAGLVGRAQGASNTLSNIQIENCINLADVAGYSSVSGIVGYMDRYVNVSNNFNAGNVSGRTHYVGGIVGGSNQSDVIKNNVSAGMVNGQSSVIGYCNNMANCTITHNYYDNQRSLPGGLGRQSRAVSYYSEDVENVAMGLSTSDILALELPDWKDTDGYPLPKMFTNEEVENIAKAYVLFSDSQKYDNVMNDFYVSDFDGVNWTSSDPTIVMVEPPAAVVAEVNGTDTLSVSKNGYSKNIIVCVTLHEDPLPIELLDFTALCNGTSVEVKWTTATERNNDYFVLERSDDAVIFTEIARIDGAGNTIESHNYLFVDNDYRGAVAYYRLCQVDYDGSRTYSEIVDVRCKDMETPLDIFVFPNPFKDDISVSFVNFDGVPARIEILDVYGRLVRSMDVEAVGNYCEYQMNFSELPAASYIMRVSTTDFVVNKNIVKQ